MSKSAVYGQLLLLLRNPLALLVVLLAIALTLLGLHNGQRQIDSQRQNLAEIAQLQEQAITDAKRRAVERQSGQGDLAASVKWWDDVTDVRGYAFYLMVDYAVKPPAPLAALAIGQSDIYPYFFRMKVDTQQALLRDKNTDHPLLHYLSRFDLSFFLVFVLPLLLIALNFNAVTQEREAGQLKMLLIQGLSPARLLWLQLGLRSALVLVPVLVISAPWLFISSGLAMVAAAAAVLGIALMILAYSGFWLALTAWCICRGQSAAHNACVLIATWLVLVMAVPMVSNTLINALAPIPSRISYLDTLRVASDQIERDNAKALSGFFHDHPELAAADKEYDYSLVKIAKIDALEKAMHSIEAQFQRRLAEQQRLAERLQWLSPASLLQQRLIRASGNDLARHKDFLAQVQNHHRALREYFQARIFAAHKRGDFQHCEGCAPVASFTDFDRQPRFVYQLPTASHSWALVSVLLMVLMSAVIGLWKLSARVDRHIEAAL